MDIDPTPFTPEHTHDLLDDPEVVAVASETMARSVTTPTDLPAVLGHLSGTLPGILFWHHRLDGGDPVPQLRLDNPKLDPKTKKPVGKYRFAGGTGSVVSVHPRMRDRFLDDTECTKTMVIVEGTKQYLVAVAYAPDDHIVVGIQGCTNWSSDGVALPEISELVRGRNVVVVFDADYRTNRDVWDQAKRLLDYSATVGAKSTLLASIPAGKKAGLDDFLRSVPADQRHQVLSNLIASASKMSGRPPAKIRSQHGSTETRFDYVSTVLGEVCVAEWERRNTDGSVDTEQSLTTELAGMSSSGSMTGRRNVRRVSTLMFAAPHIITIIKEQDDLVHKAESTISYELDIQVGREDTCTHHRVVVLDRHLHKIRGWLERAGCATVPLGQEACTPSGQQRIAEAIRRQVNEDTPTVWKVPHTGWVTHNGAAYWVDSTGGHGPSGKVSTVSAKLTGSVDAIEIPDAASFSEEDVRASFLSIINATNLFIDPTPWVIGICGSFLSLCGGHPQCAIYFIGGEGSGKTFITGGLASLISPLYGPETPMTNAEGTWPYFRDQAAQVHNCPIYIDDTRVKRGRALKDHQDNWIDLLIRVSYAGGSAMGGRKQQINGTNEWATSPRRDVRPFVVLNGENQPSNAQASTLERLLIVDVTKDTSFKRTKESLKNDPTTLQHWGSNQLKELAESGAFQPAVAWSLSNVAASITNDFNGDIVEYRKFLEDAGEQSVNMMADALAIKDGKISPRVMHVARTFLTGLALFRSFAYRSGAISMEENRKLDDAWCEYIATAIKAHVTTNITPSKTRDHYLEELKQAVGSGRFSINRSTMPNKIQLGVTTKIEMPDGSKQDCVALIPSVASLIMGVDVSQIRHAFKPMLVSGSDSPSTRKVKVNGTSIRCMVLAPEHWDPAPYIGDSEDEL